MAVKILTDKCRGCTKCVKVCPFEAITMENKKAVIGLACTGCGACVESCPFGAIETIEKHPHGDHTEEHQLTAPVLQQHDNGHDRPVL